MIKNLHIKNFQSHEDTFLEFHPSVNIIIGSSDSVKTAIIRALRKVVWNRPSGDSLRSHWGGESRIELSGEDWKIIWSKDKMDMYSLAISGKREIQFKFADKFFVAFDAIGADA